LNGKNNQDIINEQQSTLMKNQCQPCPSVAVTIAACLSLPPSSVHPITAQLSDEIDEKPA